MGKTCVCHKEERSPPASQVAITDENGQRSVVTGQEPFQEAVSHAIGRRYCGATDAPINSGQFLQDLGTLADTASAEALLRGDYTFPEDAHEATVCILKELVPLILQQRSPMNIQLKNSDFHWWRTAPEKTESSRSTVGFNHLIAQSHSEKLTSLRTSN